MREKEGKQEGKEEEGGREGERAGKMGGKERRRQEESRPKTHKALGVSRTDCGNTVESTASLYAGPCRSPQTGAICSPALHHPRISHWGH